MIMTAPLPSANACRRFFHAGDAVWHVQVTQGDAHVSIDPGEVLTTVLGSCIAACIRDPEAGVGGMNHFLLPDGAGADQGALRFGVNAMEILINGLLQRGAQRHRLEAKLFGGASVIAGLSDVGAANAGALSGG
jgi:chemotaxis protein CheD